VKPLQRISNVLCSRSVSRQGVISPDLCAGGYCIKVRLFRFCLGERHDLPLREGWMPDGRDALAARFTRAWSANADAPTIAIYLKPWRERSVAPADVASDRCFVHAVLQRHDEAVRRQILLDQWWPRPCRGTSCIRKRCRPASPGSLLRVRDMQRANGNREFHDVLCVGDAWPLRSSLIF
jgi:hypothetical protein